MPYLNCPECFYRVRTQMARELDGETSCPRCARYGRLISMFSTQVALRPGKVATHPADRAASEAGEQPRFA